MKLTFTPKPKRPVRSEQVNTLVDVDLKRQLESAAKGLETTVAAIAYEALQAWHEAYCEARAKAKD